MEYQLDLTDEANEEIRKEIVASLVEYNASKAGPSNGRPLVIALRDTSNTIMGGLWGSTGFQWLFTQLLVVPEGLRGRGVGSQLMRMAEAEAMARGCHGAWLDTFEFQARGFYERIGYKCFAQLPEYPSGFSRYFMKKSLAPVAL
ncbi:MULTISPECIES: GNAT family N-acetyltransferase [Thiorhodovibrio]|uniref:GNAT family N-acetyltransferase n=1 Tax=Thiorhodovibrio TaxID=61593 RepID=UPI00191324E4|nr:MULTISPECIES: GNAT family N-acetyltransferase [Thiorhodovibrio]MBK5970981.1 GNAT family N-acetyltransferase [Thiorhodovibrio winogradskyi]WPL10654.1 putative acetyltransferase [Thiorhodovibrio litoralis]